MARRGWKSLSGGLVRLLSSDRQHPDGVYQKTPRILAILPAGPNRLLLQTLSRDAGWGLDLAETPPDLRSGCRAEAPLIVIYDRELAPDNWRKVVGVLTKNSPRPYIILLSPNADANLWDELQRLGGSDIVRTPVTRENMLSALNRAWQLCHSQQRVRSLLPNRP